MGRPGDVFVGVEDVDLRDVDRNHRASIGTPPRQ
jgi:hypothetical protein